LISGTPREIGIRMAVGAQKINTEWMVVAHALHLTGTGIAAGTLLAVIVTRFMRSFLYGVSPLDPIAVRRLSGLLFRCWPVTFLRVVRRAWTLQSPCGTSKRDS